MLPGKDTKLVVERKKGGKRSSQDLALGLGGEALLKVSIVISAENLHHMFTVE